MDDHKQFLRERQERIRSYKEKIPFIDKGMEFLVESLQEKYSYNFSWMGLPVIQYPQDLVALQEIIFATKPDLIIETGVARGGSVVFYASMLELLGGNGAVIGIDIDIRVHNRRRIVEHPLSHRIRLVENSSVESETIEQVRRLAEGKQRIMVSLDSNHTHEHVLKELQIYAPLVTPDCYCVVFDTVVECMPKCSYPDRLWNKGDNPMTAVQEFLQSTDTFVVDREVEQKLMITAAPNGYLERVK